MSRPGIRLRYEFTAAPQGGADVDNPLFGLLAALERDGSIRHAAQALGCSYRHAWGALRDWERALQRPLVDWVQGRQARLTPYAQRLVWAERLARTRLTPHLEALRAELEQAFAQADEAALEVLVLAASHDPALPVLAQLAAAAGRLHLGIAPLPTAAALQALQAGPTGVAVWHVPRLARPSAAFERAWRPLLRPGAQVLIGSHWRCQGLLLRAGSGWPGAVAAAAAPPPVAARGTMAPVALLPSTVSAPPPMAAAPVALRATPRAAALAAALAPLAQGAWRWVGREPGSGTRVLATHLLGQAGVDVQAIDGWDTRAETTHVALAASIAAGAADVGLGLQAAGAALSGPASVTCLGPSEWRPSKAARVGRGGRPPRRRTRGRRRRRPRRPSRVPRARGRPRWGLRRALGAVFVGGLGVAVGSHGRES